MLPDLSKLSDKIGINTERVGHGKYLPLFDMWKGYNKDIEDAMQLTTNDVYHEFKTRVSESRKIRPDDLEKIAQGMIWSGAKAWNLKLVDQIGQLNEAIHKAAELASIDSYSLLYYPERKSMIEVLVEDNLNLATVKMLISNQLPEILNKPTNKLLRLYEEIQAHPVQMRTEMDFSE
jgi:protease-4